jgi:hypothetical protein
MSVVMFGYRYKSIKNRGARTKSPLQIDAKSISPQSQVGSSESETGLDR